jgi:PIN domain nuclease of toxin-antitoxin system
MTVVLDASALLALLFAEPGSELVADAIVDGACTTAVNLSEVATVLTRHERDAGAILAPVRQQVAVEPFTVQDALTAAAMYPLTASRGLSLGDRSCLALAQRLDAPAVTAEQIWAELDIDVEIHMI